MRWQSVCSQMNQREWWGGEDVSSHHTHITYIDDGEKEKEKKKRRGRKRCACRSTLFSLLSTHRHDFDRVFLFVNQSESEQTHSTCWQTWKYFYFLFINLLHQILREHRAAQLLSLSALLCFLLSFAAAIDCLEIAKDRGRRVRREKFG